MFIGKLESLAGKTTIFLCDTQNYVYRRIYVEYAGRILSAL